MSERKIPRGSLSEPITQREDDGQYQIGWHDDAAGPFESRRFALAVAANQEARRARAAVSS